jgi:hypothetical protein
MVDRKAHFVAVRTAAMSVDRLDASKAHEMVSLSAVELDVKKAYQWVELMVG